MKQLVLALALASSVSACFAEPPARVCVRSDAPAYAGPRRPADTSSAAVWGVADLHAHPATHLAFAGNPEGEGGFIWQPPGLRVPPECEGDLLPMPPCDPQTHASENDAVRRQTRRQVFSDIVSESFFPHGSRGADDLRRDGVDRSFSDWPHGRDIFHQQMQVSALRRAWEGGLRLMIASVTDNPALAALLETDAFPGSLRLESDLPSLEAQLDFIHALADANPSWLEVVRTPDQAELAIREGRLAIILSLEGDYVPIEEVERLYREKGVRHVTPVHLVDNPIGGAAIFSEVFFSASELEQPLFGADRRYPAVLADPFGDFRIGRAVRLEVQNVKLDLPPVEIDVHRGLGLESRAACGLEGIPADFGHRNARRLLRGEDIERMFELGMLVDVTHMGWRALEDTLRLAARRGVPVMSSHTDVRDRCSRAGSERDLAYRQARCIGELGGVIGLGTTGRPSFEACEWEGPAVLLSARGAPLFVLDDSAPSARVAVDPGVDGAIAVTPPVPSSDAPVSSVALDLEVDAEEELADGVVVAVVVERWDGARYEVEHPVSTSAEVQIAVDAALPAPAEAGCPPPSALGARVRSVTVELLDTESCLPSDRAAAVVQVKGLRFDGAPRPAAIEEVHLSSARGRARVYDGEVRRPGAVDASWRGAGPGDAAHTDHVLLRVRSGAPEVDGLAARGLGGAAPFFEGAQVEARLWSRDPAGACRADGAAWFSLNRGAIWAPGTEYVAYAPARPSAVCGVELRLSEPDLRREALAVDLVRVEAVEDPVAGWVRGYRRVLESEMAGRPGAIALGTDVNGLAPQFPFAKRDPDYPLAAGGIARVQRAARIGQVELRFAERGLAGYALLPELFEAVAHRDRVGGESCAPEPPTSSPGAVEESLFRSAQGVIDMWRQVLRPTPERPRPACAELGP